MRNRQLALRVLLGAWAVILLITLFKAGLALAGLYDVNWSQELTLLVLIGLPGLGALAVLTGRPVAKDARDTDAR